MASKSKRVESDEQTRRRKTSQREAIQEVFRKDDRPLSVPEILEASRRAVFSLNQATVYRNVKILVDTGWLKKVNVPAIGTFYERAVKDHHHHFRCRACDRIFDLFGCALGETITTPPGFVAEDHEVILVRRLSFLQSLVGSLSRTPL